MRARLSAEAVRRTRSFLMCVLFAAAVAASAREARAEPGAQTRALDLFEQSAKAYREGRFQDAVDLLLEARRSKPEPVLLYNLGRAYEALGKYTEAADAYEGYLKEDSKAADRRSIEGRVANLRAQAAELERARAAPNAPVPSDEPRRDRPKDPPPREESPSIVPWIVAGAGVAVIGGGLVLGAVAKGRHSDAVAEPRQAAAADAQRSAESLATGATVTIIAGSVVAAVGLAWLGVRALSSPSSPSPSASQPRVNVVPGIASLAVEGRF